MLTLQETALLSYLIATGAAITTIFFLFISAMATIVERFTGAKSANEISGWSIKMAKFFMVVFVGAVIVLPLCAIISGLTGSEVICS